jgi:hypothetical protein
MKVFTNGTDTVVAPSLEHVPAILAAHYGSTMEQEGWTLDEWDEVPDDKPITIHNAHGNGYDDVETRAAAEWAAKDGACFLCSTEW